MATVLQVHCGAAGRHLFLHVAIIVILFHCTADADADATSVPGCDAVVLAHLGKRATNEFRQACDQYFGTPPTTAKETVEYGSFLIGFGQEHEQSTNDRAGARLFYSAAASVLRHADQMEGQPQDDPRTLSFLGDTLGFLGDARGGAEAHGRVIANARGEDLVRSRHTFYILVNYGQGLIKSGQCIKVEALTKRVLPICSSQDQDQGQDQTLFGDCLFYMHRWRAVCLARQGEFGAAKEAFLKAKASARDMPDDEMLQREHLPLWTEMMALPTHPDEGRVGVGRVQTLTEDKKKTSRPAPDSSLSAERGAWYARANMYHI